jgi:hypothetical protein
MTKTEKGFKKFVRTSNLSCSIAGLGKIEKMLNLGSQRKKNLFRSDFISNCVDFLCSVQKLSRLW